MVQLPPNFNFPGAQSGIPQGIFELIQSMQGMGGMGGGLGQSIGQLMNPSLGHSTGSPLPTLPNMPTLPNAPAIDPRGPKPPVVPEVPVKAKQVPGFVVGPNGQINHGMTGEATTDAQKLEQMKLHNVRNQQVRDRPGRR